MTATKWIKGQDILLNLDKIADVVHKKQDNTVMAYTASGYGIRVFKGSSDECQRVYDKIRNVIDAVPIG